jgi:hypothetical protein
LSLKLLTVVGVIIALIAGISIVCVMPPADDFNPENTYWNGMSTARAELNLQPVSMSAIGRLDSSSALLIIGPSKPITDGEAESVKSYVSKGGLLILADDFGTGNSLLEKLGVKFRLSGNLLVDPLFKERGKVLPKIVKLEKVPTSHISELVLNYATTIEGSGFRVLAYSCSFSYLDLNLNFKHDAGEPKGPFPVIVETSYGKGKIIVISDSSFLINSMVGLGDNLEFVRAVAGDRRILLDTSHWTPSLHSKARATLLYFFGLLNIPEVKYSVVMLALIFISMVKIKPAKTIISEVEEVLKRHPTWNKKLLEKLDKELRE